MNSQGFLKLYESFLYSEDLQAGVVAQRLNAAYEFCKFVEGERASAAARKLHDRKCDVLSGTEISTLLNAIGADPAADLLNDVVKIILNTGLRLGELRSLHAKDVDLGTRTLEVCPSKASGHRTVPFNDAAAQVLDACIKANPHSVLVFGDSSGVHINKAMRQLAKISKQVLGRSVSCHTLRNTFVASMISVGMPPDVLSHICDWRQPYSSLMRFSAVRPPEVAQAYTEAMKTVKGEKE